MKRSFIISIYNCDESILLCTKNRISFQDTQARLLDVTSNAYVKPLTVELKV